MQLKNQEQVVKKIGILGSTGSVGTQALEVIRNFPDQFELQLLTAYNNVDLLILQALEFRPKVVVIGQEQQASKLKAALKHAGIRVYSGQPALVDMVQDESLDLVLTALVGSVGLEPTVAAIKAGKDIALANKETLVVGGKLVMELAHKHNVQILPVDSEHSAIFQCLQGEQANRLEKIILTASGGPFRGWTKVQLQEVSVAQALKHPNWSMGAKISIDSASMMNKGLEVIEARWLFDISADQIDVVVHPQSIVHSMVQFQDGSVISQMGVPDMKLPIQYALSYPQRFQNNFKRLSFSDYPTLTFEEPNREVFRNLDLAYQALEKEKGMPCVMNAANEVVVAAFLKEQIGFLEMSDVIEETMASMPYEQVNDVADYIALDQASRKHASLLIEKINRKK